jgi:sugar phosphate isomerase/epimerase
MGAAAQEQPGAAVPIPLGFDTYSLNRSGWKALEYLDYAAAQKLDTLQFSSLSNYESFEPAYLQKIKDSAARLGILVEGGMDSICPTSASFRKTAGDAASQVRQGLRVCKAIGATVMRCYLGTEADRLGAIPIEGHMENTVKVLQSVRAEALDLGVKVALENHAGDLLAREMKTLITAAGTDFVGSNLDTGNPVWVAEDPMLTMEILGPYAITTHIRDFGGLRAPARRGGPMGGDGRRLHRLRADHGEVPPTLSQSGLPTRGDHRLGAEGAGVQRAGLLEGVPENAGLRFRPVPATGKERASVDGSHAHRRWARADPTAGVSSRLKGAAARGPGAQLRIRQKTTGCGHSLAGVGAPRPPSP